jgi:elongation factor 1-gamma
VKGKKEEEKKDQPKKKVEEKKQDEDEDDENKEKPNEDPLALLPPSKFSIDDWKRRFLASKNQKEEFEWLWQNFDHEGWSCW